MTITWWKSTVARGPGFIICSFADLNGAGVYKGKTYYWEFSRMFGPTFTRKDGEFLKRQPGPRSNAWKCWEAWYEQLEADQIEAGQIARLPDQGSEKP